jgi:hypothetical protein
MPSTRTTIRTSAFRPESLRVLGQIYDEVWACVSADFRDDRDRIEAAQIRLTMIILNLAKDGQLGRHQITRTASRLICQARPQNSIDD